MTSEQPWWAADAGPGCLLLATPTLTDPNFARSVVYLIEHGPGGSLGVIVNRPSRTPVGAVLSSWQDAMSEPAVIYDGGPVQRDGALCLAETAAASGSEVTIGVIDLDGSVDEARAHSQRFRVFAGHAGWGDDQLAAEVAEGAWYVLPGRPSDVFSGQPAQLWHTVLRRQPFPLSLMSTFPEDPSTN